MLVLVPAPPWRRSTMISAVSSAAASSRCTGSPASGKFSRARSVWAPCRPAAGTATSPSRSRSMRVSPLMPSSSAAGPPASVAEDHLLDVHALDLVERGHHRRGLVVAAEELDEHDAARRAHVGVHVVQPDARPDVAAVLGEDLLHVHRVLQPVGDVDAEDDVVVVHVESSLVVCGSQQSTSRPPARTWSSIFWVCARRTSSISPTLRAMRSSPAARVWSLP